LLEGGYRTVLTARDVEKIADLASAHPENSLPLALDVDNPAQVAAAIKAALEKFGRIDVLVNNAGFGYLSAVEEGEDAEIRAMFETNVFGLAAMTRAVLPAMRAQKNGAVVNISSMGGVVGFPGVGYYNATKFAVEGLSEALAKEVAPFGIKVLIVEPGPFRTDWAGRSLRVPKQPIEAYKETAIARRAAIQGYSGAQPGDPIRAARAMIAVVECPDAPLRLVLGGVAYDTILGKLDAFRAEIADHRDISLGADFPKGE
jgi:NAD(P)-dependent dehydrogenase (short-subunit alcohol dehydrogenase family)